MVTMQESATLGELLAARRGEHPKTTAAETIGVSRQMYGQWEDDYTVPGLEWVEPLAHYLSITRVEVMEAIYRSWQHRFGGGEDEAPIIHVTAHPTYEDLEERLVRATYRVATELLAV